MKAWVVTMEGILETGVDFGSAMTCSGMAPPALQLFLGFDSCCYDFSKLYLDNQFLLRSS